ncbi:MAG: GAF domain-containing sensor histidine kinase, partial [Anaerolineales bacterium]|nr:GAF domain-containing sensor histidine kinase [Anaerolineales bacterium]
ASILTLDEKGPFLRFLAIPWFHRQALQDVRVPLKGSLAGRSLTSDQVVIALDVSREPDHFKGADQASGFVTRSLIAAPIHHLGKALAVLQAVNLSAAPDAEDLLLLSFLTSQAAIGFHLVALQTKDKKANEEMKQLERMKSDFIAIASHELRTPLGLVLGHSTFLREVIDPNYRPQMDIIVRNAMRLKEIVDNMANLENFQRGTSSLRRQTFSVKRLVEETRDSFYQEATQKGLSIQVKTDSSPMVVEGDVEKIRIALDNLVRNAITFTNPGGHVLITAYPKSDYVEVSVIDDGIGIPAADLPRIFERFYQAESHLTRKHGGLGLGLSVAKIMIEMHGGRIWAESVEGKGSKFTFLLPLVSSKNKITSSVEQS